jgi:hypothetical protein
MSEFGKEVAETLHDVKRDFASKPQRRLSGDANAGSVEIDKSMREEICPTRVCSNITASEPLR